MEIITGKSYTDQPAHNNLKELFDIAVKRFSDRIAISWRPVLSDKKPTHITYKQMGEDVDALQTMLYDESITTERRIGIVGVNSYHWAISYYGAVNGIGTAVPLDPLLTAVELVNLLQRGKVDTLICDSRFVEMLVPYLDELPLLKHKIMMVCSRDSEKKAKQIAAIAEEHDFKDMEDLLQAGRKKLKEGFVTPLKEVLPDTLASIVFTSGTTSQSKGVMLAHYNITSNAASLLRIISLPEKSKYLSILPLHHCLENTCGLHAVLLLGGNICYCDGLRYISQNLMEYKPELLIGVPALYDSFYKKVKLALKKQNVENTFKKARKVSNFLRNFNIDVRQKLFKKVLDQFGGNLKLCIVGAAHQRIEVVRFFDELGIKLIEGYGLTECSPVVSGGNSYINPMGTCGHPIANLTVAIDNENDGEDGEVLVKVGTFPNHKPGWKNEPPTGNREDDVHITMLGYYENDEANEEIFAKDGWLRTMDIGHFDPETKGLVLTGRAKSMIVLNSGKKVFPEEIEQKLNDVDLIGDSVVWAEPSHDELALIARLQLDEEYLEVFRKELEAKGFTEDEIVRKLEDVLSKEVDRINGEMIKFKHIRHFYFSNADMIRTTTRKIKRQQEVDRIRAFFKDVQGKDGIDLTVKNLDSIQFGSYEKE